MKRSFLSMVVAASLVTVGACAGDEANDDIEPVEDVMQPAPPPPPAPMPMDTPATGDTTGGMGRDTLTTPRR
jgi:hypothetical protein